MDPTIVSLIAAFSSAIAALFGALMVSMRQQREDWKKLYDNEKVDHKETLKEASKQTQENARAVRDLADFIHELPRRREDWARTSERMG